MAEDPRLKGWHDSGLRGAEFSLTRFTQNPKWRDRCEFCGERFAESGTAADAEGTPTKGYLMVGDHPGGPDYHWICPGCFEDFRKRFNWNVRDEPAG